MARYIGNYKVIRELGSGHFGSVYLAVGEVPGRRGSPSRRRVVAIKKLKKPSSNSVRLLLQEFALLDQVKHRSVVRVFEYLDDDCAVVMEYIHGVSLRQLLDELEKAREQAFTEAAIEIASEIADALYQAFTTPGDNGEPLQLVHRDLKPANIMLTPSGEVKVLDWGLARVDNTDFLPDEKERIKGTMLYMAPEQAQGLEIDHRTDLFALGLILFELLEGRAVYQVPRNALDPLAEIRELIRNGDTRDACGQLETRLPALGPIITQALQPRPYDRYRNGQDMMVDLRRQLYRDRGAYLEEFCEFFFGSIHDIGDAVTVDSLGNDASSGGRPRGHKSIEERLRESMAGEEQARDRVQTTPGRGGHSMSNSKGPKPPSIPSSGGGAPRVPSSAQDLGPGVKKVGQRSPEETGMLEMVPLSGDVGGLESGVDPSATSFFAIPAPKAGRGSSSSSPSGGPPPPPSGGVMRPPGPPPSIVRGPPPSAPPPMVRGPVAPPAGSSPFQVSGVTPSAAESDNRVNSTRVFAILFAVFLMVCMAVVLAVWIGDQKDSSRDEDDKEESSASEDLTRSGVTYDADDADDEEDAPLSDDPPVTNQTGSSSGGRSGNSGSRGSNTGKTTPAVRSGGSTGSSGQLSVRLAGLAVPYRTVKGTCDGVSIPSTSISGGAASLGKVPNGASCILQFSGGGPAPGKSAFTFEGRSVTCQGIGTVLCQ